MKQLLIFPLLLLCCRGMLANAFLPEMDRPIAYSGTHWNSDEGYDTAPIEAEGTFTSVAKFDSGEIVRFSLVPTGKPKSSRTFPAFLFWVANDGAIYQFASDNLRQPPKVGPLDTIIPAVNEHGHFQSAEKSGGETVIVASEFGLRWTSDPWTTEINSDNAGLARYRSYHPSGHFRRMLWQQGLGITEIAAGQGAGQDGWELHRTAAAKEKITDIARILAVLPSEFFPETQALSSLKASEKRAAIAAIKTEGELPGLNARIEVDRSNGWAQISSNTDGEGETLDAVLWKRKDGTPLLIMALQKWSSGPTTTTAIRAVEYRDGKFRHVTTSLPLPSEGDFHTPENAEKRPPRHLIEGKWILPRKGTTIVIRPPNEEGADLMPESFTSDESYYFELTWDGVEFTSKTLPRTIPPPPYEPKIWAMQAIEPTPSALFLQRDGDKISGKLEQRGKSIPITGKLEQDGTVSLTIEGKDTISAKLDKPENLLTLAGAFSEDSEFTFEAVPIEPEAPPLPGYRILGEEGVYFPQFEASTPDWKGINAKIASFVAGEKEGYKKAIQSIKDKDETILDITFRIAGVRENTLSVSFTVHRYFGGPHGQIHFANFNYDFRNHRFLQIGDILRDGWQPTVAKLLNAALVEQGGQEEGQNLITEQMLNELPWVLELPNNLSFAIAPETLSSTNVEAHLSIPWETLHEQDLIKKGGAFDPHRD